MAPNVAKIGVAMAVSASLLPRSVTGQAAAPVTIQFTGQAPEMKIYPGGDQGGKDTWFMFSFAKVRELDAKGEELIEHSIARLSTTQTKFNQEKRKINGVDATVTRVETPLQNVLGSCGMNRDMYIGPATIAIETFVFAKDAMVEYGDDMVEIPSGFMKFNIDSKEWPFCGEGHKLEVNLEVELEGGNVAEWFSSRQSTRSGPVGKEMRVNAGAKKIEIDLPTVVVVDDVTSTCSVELDTEGGKNTLRFTFPHFKKTLMYDPVAGAVDADASDDPEAEEDGASAQAGLMADGGIRWYISPLVVAIFAAVIVLAGST
mmetsp:Transcript_91139/g.262858  ORF Transcript_91139/g.262858 Transcript_91139/m.262858 type:complete len:316 (+) Transcript_91139:98-1045(+)